MSLMTEIAKSVLKVSTRSVEKKMDFQALCEQGGNFQKLGNWEKAFECYEEALSLNFNSSKAWISRAYCLSELGRYEDAFDSYDRAIQLGDPTGDAIILKKGLQKDLRIDKLCEDAADYLAKSDKTRAINCLAEAETLDVPGIDRLEYAIKKNKQLQMFYSSERKNIRAIYRKLKGLD